MDMDSPWAFRIVPGGGGSTTGVGAGLLGAFESPPQAAISANRIKNFITEKLDQFEPALGEFGVLFPLALLRANCLAVVSHIQLRKRANRGTERQGSTVQLFYALLIRLSA